MGSGLTGSLPPSDRASTSRSSATRDSRSVSSAAEASADRSSPAGRGRRRASSSSVRSDASGVRSSWLASETNRRSWASAVSRRSSMVLRVVLSRLISSSPGGSGSRRPGSEADTASASRRIDSTGRSAAAASR